jgi:hypothetical protein
MGRIFSPLQGRRHAVLAQGLAAKNHSSGRTAGCPDIAFYAPHHAGPGLAWPNQGRTGCDESATISKLKDGGFESLTTRLRPHRNAGSKQATEK